MGLRSNGRPAWFSEVGGLKGLGLPTPLHQLKAEFFKTLSHPTRIRVLELLSEHERSVGEMLPEVGIEASSLSQQLAVLRRSGLVTSRREGSVVYYALTSPEVAELLAVARHILTTVLTGHAVMLTDLTAENPGVRKPKASGRRAG